MHKVYMSSQTNHLLRQTITERMDSVNICKKKKKENEENRQTIETDV